MELNQFDGLLHAPSGRVFDPETGREVELEDNVSLQLRHKYSFDKMAEDGYLADQAADREADF